MRSQLSSFTTLAAAAAVAASMLSCNLTGGIDNAKSRDELILDAQAKMDNGDCGGAVSILSALGTQDDRSNQMLGTAYLCAAGATANRIDGALGAFNPSSANLKVIGDLANRMVPFVAGGDTSILNGITAFNNMSVGDVRSVWQIYGNIVLIAFLEAKAAGANATAVVNTSVAPSACSAATCTTGGAACTAGMSDADAQTALTALNNAATAANNTSIQNVTKIVTQLQTLLGGQTGSNAMRCILFQNTF